MFAFQIYGDFSGYSDIAIGAAKLFGIKLMRNFNVPYFSRNVAEFWKRWHISLNTWFVDYIYIPLGGSREGKWKTFRNTMVIFTVSGLWHGANWTFVTWGIYHGLLFLPLLLMGTAKKYNSDIATIKQLPQMFLTFVLVVIGWIIFRADTIGQAFGYLTNILSPNNGFFPCHEDLASFKKPVVWIALMLCVEWITRKCSHNFDLMSDEVCLSGTFRNLYFSCVSKTYLRWLVYFLFAIIVLVYGGQQAEFIYFQF